MLQKLLDKFKVSTKLIFLVVILCSLIITIGAYGLFSLNTMNNTTQDIYVNRITPMEQLINIRYAYARNIVFTLQELKDNSVPLAKAQERMNKADTDIVRYWQAYKLTYLTPEEAELAKSAEVVMHRADSAIALERAKLSQSGTVNLKNIETEGLFRVIYPVVDKLNALLELQVSVSKDLLESNNQEYHTTRKKFYILIAAALIFGFTLFLAILFDTKRLIKNLQSSYVEVKELSEKTISQEREKQEILSEQKEKLEVQVEERTRDILEQKKVIEEQKQVVEEKNKDITSSITYAKRLQDAILPPMSLIKQYLPESFVLYKPKDIVAGDFYWMERAGDTILIAAADCTGHGVPGALVSVVCSNALNRTVKEFKITEPGKILDKVRELVLETFEKSEDNVQDGMDISLCCLNTKTNEIQWSGAYNSLWYIHKGEMNELPADKQPIGKHDKPEPFNTHNLNLHKGDTLYLFTDGYADQFGGPKGKKFKYKQLQDLLLANAAKPMGEQRKEVDITLEGWKGSLEQVDDILVIGIRI
ncbi:MAG TPA: SpoIIE family protein phosphatase [Bacteroidia bacterium]|nr:SpoIIE family protein phosphatase [Bacteroidia bacterium]